MWPMPRSRWAAQRREQTGTAGAHLGTGPAWPLPRGARCWLAAGPGAGRCCALQARRSPVARSRGAGLKVEEKDEGWLGRCCLQGLVARPICLGVHCLCAGSQWEKQRPECSRGQLNAVHWDGPDCDSQWGRRVPCIQAPCQQHQWAWDVVIATVHCHRTWLGYMPMPLGCEYPAVMLPCCCCIHIDERGVGAGVGK